MRSLRPLLLAFGLAALLLTSAAPAQAAAGDSVPVIVPEVAVTGDSIWIGYNVCPVAVLGDPEPCSGPRKLVEIPLGTDPCEAYPTLPGCQPIEPCDLPDVPGLCGEPLPTLCDDVSDNVPGTCGNPLPEVPELCRVGTVLDFCNGQCQVTVQFDPCDGDCTLGNVEVCDPEPCDINDNLPGTCGNPLPSVPDFCEDVNGNLPGTCGNPLPTLCEDVSDNVPGTCGNPLPEVPELCRVGTVVDTCNGQCQVTVQFDPCDGDCTLGNVEVCDPEPCDINDNLPGTCGNPLPSVPDFCEDVNDNLPGTCGNPLPDVPDPCEPVGNVHPCDPSILVVDGELCVYRQSLSGGDRDLLFCVPINR